MATDTDNASPTEPLTIRLPADVAAQLRERARRNYRPISQEVRWALDEAWGSESVEEAA